MPTAPETDSDHTRMTVSVPADDAAGRLLAALLATGGLIEQPADPVPTESAR